MTYYLAVDIGASSGRHILGSVENGKICLEEIYRFDNGIEPQDGALTWDIAHLLREVKAGIARCKELGKLPATVAIDTWGVDYVLLDADENEILPAFSYRDSRTAAALEEVHGLIPPRELYARTGIQQQAFNTVYQLYCDKKSGKLGRAAHFLMMPEYLSFGSSPSSAFPINPLIWNPSSCSFSISALYCRARAPVPITTTCLRLYPFFRKLLSTSRIRTYLPVRKRMVIR